MKRISNFLRKNDSAKVTAQPIAGYHTLLFRLKYPELALRRNIEGSVRLSVLVDEEGLVKDMAVLAEYGDGQFGFAEETMRVLKRSKWEPWIMDGRKTKVWVEVPISFRLK